MSVVPDLSRLAFLETATSTYQKAIDKAAGFLMARGIGRELAREYRLGVVDEPCSGHEQYAGRLAIPYISFAGITTIRFRALDDSHPKYLSLPRDVGRIYNTQAFFVPGNRIAITEGEFDAMVVHEFGGIPAVGMQGASAWKPLYRKCFTGFEDILVIGDGDESGAKFTDRIVNELDNARPIYLPDGEDCNSILANEGPMGLSELLS